MDMDRYIGRLLDGRYEIMEVIGTGGMAVVYKARCHRLNRLVAVKILKDELTQDEEFRRRFHAESQAVAALSHPNIVSVYDVSTTDDADFIVMELIDGITLKQYMEKKGVLNWKETLHFAIQIAKALDHAHSRGIVHRDIKPHNVMVLKNGSVKVADFGIAQVMTKSSTLTKEALGSVHYISPEQAKGGRVDSRSDLYSLGVVMYEMMAGRPPFDGETPVSVAVQHINGNAAMPSSLNPNIPGGLEQIIMKAMEREPMRRYSTATSMLYDMDEFRKDPTILFDYNNTSISLDDATLIQSTPSETPEKAEPEKLTVKPEQQSIPTPPRTRNPQPPRKRRKKHKHREEIVEDVDRGGRIATITVALFSLVAIVAVAIVIYMLFQGGIGNNVNENLIIVPNLQNKVYEDEKSSDNYTIIIDHYAYDEFYEKGHIISQEPEANKRMEKGDTIYVVVSAGPAPEVMTMDPGLVGMGVEDARQYLTVTQGIDDIQIKTVEVYSERPVGEVTDTEPGPGKEIKGDTIITLYVSKGQEIKKVTMVNLTSYPDEESVMNWLNVNGFTAVTVIREPNNVIPAGKVFYQSIPAFTQVQVDTPLTIKISEGSGSTDVVLPTPPQLDPEDYVTKTVIIELAQEAAQPYTLSIYREVDGKPMELIEEREILPGTLSIQVNLSGKDIMHFLVQPSEGMGDAWLLQVDFNAPVGPELPGGGTEIPVGGTEDGAQ